MSRDSSNSSRRKSGSNLSLQLLDHPEGSRGSKRSRASTETLPSNASTGSARSSLFGGLRRRSSQLRLFGDEEETVTSASLLAPATRFPSNDASSFESPKKTPRISNGLSAQAQASSSLFGAVMNNVTSSSSSKKAESTPAKETPSKISSFRNFLASPGGFQLMNFVNSVASPFKYRSTPRKSIPSNGAAKNPSISSPTATPLSSASNTAASPATLTPRHEREWHPANVSDTQVELLDWTLKSKLEFQSTPQLPISHHSTQVRHVARRNFLLSGSSTNSGPMFGGDENDRTSLAQAAAIQWQENLLYWQHPVSYPKMALSKLPATMPSTSGQQMPLRRRASMSNMWTSNTKKPDDENSQFVSSEPSVINNDSLLPNGGNSNINVRRKHQLTERDIEWQEAFRSMSSTWMLRVQECQSDEITEVADIYCYSVANDHVVLFRVGQSKDTEQEKPAFIPEIVVTSCTLDVREQLRTMGAKWRLLENYNYSNTEEYLDDTKVLSATGKNLLSPNGETADLKALRRAQVSGKVAGADVNFSLGPRKTKKRRILSPLYLQGVDDCLAFCEVYCNLIGDIVQLPSRNHRSGPALDVPRLLCRKLGPFLHANLQTLDVRLSQQENESVVKVTGIVLPCAVRGLMASALHSMRADAPPPQDEDEDEDEVGVGSHHAIIHLSLYDADRKPSAAIMGDPASKYLNAKTWKDAEGFEYCRYQEMIETVVWDIRQPTDVAFKLDHMAQHLLG